MFFNPNSDFLKKKLELFENKLFLSFFSENFWGIFKVCRWKLFKNLFFWLKTFVSCWRALKLERQKKLFELFPEILPKIVLVLFFWRETLKLHVSCWRALKLWALELSPSPESSPIPFQITNHESFNIHN